MLGTDKDQPRHLVDPAEASHSQSENIRLPQGGAALLQKGQKESFPVGVRGSARIDCILGNSETYLEVATLAYLPTSWGTRHSLFFRVLSTG